MEGLHQLLTPISGWSDDNNSSLHHFAIRSFTLHFFSFCMQNDSKGKSEGSDERRGFFYSFTRGKPRS